MNIGEVLLADRLREKGRGHRRHLHASSRGLGPLQARPRDGDAGRHLGDAGACPSSVGESRHRRAHGRGAAALHAHQLRPGHRRRAPARRARSSRRTRRPTTWWSTYLASASPRSGAAARRRRAEGRCSRSPSTASRPRKGAGPYIGQGAGRQARAGKIWIDMTGGTEGPKKIIEKLADHGVGTIVGMHMSQELRDEADKQPHPRGHRRPHEQRLARRQPAAGRVRAGAASRSSPPRASSACGATRRGKLIAD